MEDTDTTGATAGETEVRSTYTPAFNPKQSTDIDYNIVKEFPGELQVFIDDMDRYVFAVAVDETAKHNPQRITTRAEKSGNGFKLTGSKSFVVQGASADMLVVAALVWTVCRLARPRSARVRALLWLFVPVKGLFALLIGSTFVV